MHLFKYDVPPTNLSSIFSSFLLHSSAEAGAIAVRILSELGLLLVENYNLTTPVGLRPGREFLATFISFWEKSVLHYACSLGRAT